MSNNGDGLLGAFRAAIQPLEPPQEDLQQRIWTTDPVGEFTRVMSREELQKMLQEGLLDEAQQLIKPEVKPEIYDTQIRTFLPEQASDTAKRVAHNFQHPMLTYNLVKGKK